MPVHQDSYQREPVQNFNITFAILVFHKKKNKKKEKKNILNDSPAVL